MTNRTRALAFVVAAAPLLAVQTPPAGDRVVFRVPVTGVIEMGLAPFVERALDEAEEAGAGAVILDIDTPGGRVDAAERIADAVSDASVPVYAFVNRRAFSAGAMIALSAQRIYMRPGAVMGAVTPVDATGEKAPEKIVSAMRSTMRALAEARGLDPRVAEAMVDEDIAIPGVTEAGKLLTLTTSEAVALGYAEEVEDWDPLMRVIGAAGARVQVLEVNWAERVVRFLTHPVVAPLLLSLGFIGLIIELNAPGLGLPGAVGLTSLGLFFGSHLLIGLAGLEALLLFGAGIVLIGIEVLMLPGMGLVGLLGAAGVLAGLYLTLIGQLPTSADLTRGATILSATIIVVVVLSWFLLRRLPSSRRLGLSGIFLKQDTGRDVGYESATRRVELVGKEGVALTDLRPSGTGLFGEERIDVVSESEWIERGAPIRIVVSEGYRHVVRLVKALESP